ncbi:MAG: hypothetical protein H0U56_15500 [Methylibium sp.]|nr:hypothetical protein [Methylibium sp.]
MSNTDGIEREAERVYSRVGADLNRGASPTRLVEGVLGAGALRWADGDWLRAGGAIARVGRHWRVYLNRRYPVRNLRFVALHELAHYVLGGGATEDDCDALAAVLLAPRRAFERAMASMARPRFVPARVYGNLSAWFRCTDSFAAMRLSEVTGAPLVLISPARARVRGAPYPWPAEFERLVRAPVLPGLRKARLQDDPSRVVLQAR